MTMKQDIRQRPLRKASIMGAENYSGVTFYLSGILPPAPLGFFFYGFVVF
jgi:hypothetical protein